MGYKSIPMFPTYLSIDKLIPLKEVELSSEQVKEVLAEIEPPPGIGTTALQNAKEQQVIILKLQLRNVFLLCDQTPYEAVKQTFRNVQRLTALVFSKGIIDAMPEAMLEEIDRNLPPSEEFYNREEYERLMKKETQIFKEELLKLVPGHEKEINTLLMTEQERKIYSMKPEERKIYMGKNSGPSIESIIAVKEKAAETIRSVLEKKSNTKVIDPRVYRDFLDQISESYAKAYVPAGTTVGVLAAQSMGGPATQIILSGFHKAGQQSGKSEGFKRIEQVLNVSKVTSNPQTMLYFVEPDTNPTNMDAVLHAGTFQSITEKRKLIEYITVQDIVKDERILLSDEIKQRGLDKMVKMHQLLRKEKAGQAELELLPVCMELTLDTYKMYAHDILISHVAFRLEGYPGIDTVIAIWSSQSVKSSPHNGKIYIFIDERKNMGLGRSESIETAYIQFFLTVFKSTFPKNRVSGMEGISYIEAVKQDTLDVVTDTAKGQEFWTISTNYLTTRLMGISLMDVVRLYEHVCDSRGDTIRQRGFLIFSKENPTKKIKDLTVPLMQKLCNIMSVEGKEGKWQMSFDQVGLDTQNITKESILSLFSPYYTIEEKDGIYKIVMEDNPSEYFTSLYNYRFIYMAQCSGINMKETVWLEDIDRYRFHVNDITIMSEYFGIDNVRYYIVEEIHRVLGKHNISINKRHMTVLIDYMTNTGILAGISYNGVRKRKADPLVAASFERAVAVLAEGAAMGKKERLDRVSSSLYTGGTAYNIGTGLYNLIGKKGVSEGAAGSGQQEPDDFILIEGLEEKRELYTAEEDIDVVEYGEEITIPDLQSVSQPVSSPTLISSSLVTRTLQESLAGTNLKVADGKDESPRYEPSDIGAGRQPVSPSYSSSPPIVSVSSAIGPPVRREQVSPSYSSSVPVLSAPAPVPAPAPAPAPAVVSQVGALPSLRGRSTKF